MTFLSLINPKQRQWLVLFTLLCWVIPFLGVMGFMIFVPSPVPDQADRGKTVTEQKAETKVAAFDQKNEAEQGAASAEASAVKAAETERRQEAAAPPPVPPEQLKPATNVAEAAKPGANNQADGIDLDLLARVIYAEARGEPFEGQVAVGAVLINRLRNPRFPNDLWSIVFKKGEFCTVRDGQIWLRPNATAYRAARLAKAGWDPTNGALYFYNPSKTTSKWIWSRTVTARIGRHVFAA